jgi:hypothetical protein
MGLDPRDTVRSSALRSAWPELQMRIIQLAREGSPPAGLRLLHAHANPISWPAPGFAGSNPICPARQTGLYQLTCAQDVTGECGGRHAVATHGASLADAVKQVVYVTYVRYQSEVAKCQRLKIVCRDLGPSCRCASHSWHARGLRHPGCAYLRPNCHANPIRWPAPGFASSNPTCPARQCSLCGACPTRRNMPDIPARRATLRPGHRDR